MRRNRGFTLIEMMIVVAVISILATLAFSWMRAARRNAGVAAISYELEMRVDQLPFVALSEQTDQLLVIADVPNNDAAECGSILSAGCARVFHLRGPAAAWRLQDFDVGAPGANVAAIVDEERLGQGVRFHLAAAGAALPSPFNAFSATFEVFDDDLVADCAGNRKCVAYRFRANGRVAAEPPDPAAPPTALKSGHAIALGSELTGEYRGARQVGVLVALPSGIARTFAVP